MRLLFAAAWVLLSALAQPQRTAIEQLAALQQKAEAAAKAGNQAARIAANRQLFHLLNGNPDVLLALARAHGAAGDLHSALAALKEFANLGLADDAQISGQDPRYAPLKSLREYQQVIQRFRQNEAPVALAQPAITLPDAGLVPEDIDYDPGNGTFLITSIREAKIVRVAPDGSTTGFAAAPDHWPMAAIKIDAARKRVWASEVAFDGFVLAPRNAWGRSAVVCYDLATGRLLRRIEGPPHTALGDMVLTAGGDPILSDGDGGGLYRVSQNTIAAIDTADFISPQTASVVPGSGKLLVPDYARGIATFSLATRRVSWLNADNTDKVALNGIDGLYVWRDALIVTQNGTTPERVVEFRLDGKRTHIVAQKVIQQAAPGLDDPTHGVIVGNTFWFIANSGWAQLDEHGNFRPRAALTPARILRYNLGEAPRSSPVARTR